MKIFMNENDANKWYSVPRKTKWQKMLHDMCKRHNVQAEECFVSRWIVPFGETQWRPVANQKDFQSNRPGRNAAEFRLCFTNGDDIIAVRSEAMNEQERNRTPEDQAHSS